MDSRLALARTNTYDLISRVYLNGLTSRLFPFVEAIPEFAAAIKEVLPVNQRAASNGNKTALSIPSEDVFEGFAADHYDLFGSNVFPYQSMFLAEDRNLGGHITVGLLDYCQEVGFEITQHSEGPDHIGVALAVLAFLCGAEHDASEDKLPEIVLRMRALQRRFLDEQLLRWLPGLSYVIQRQDCPIFYHVLASLTLDLVLEHRMELKDDPPSARVTLALPQLPDLLVREKTGLKDIASYLVTPALSGIYLSQEDIRRLARSHNLPRGFGSRQQVLSNLLRSAAEFESIAALFEDIDEILENWKDFYTTLGEQNPTLQQISGEWVSRLEITEEMTAQIRRAA